jgi:hypothetical protein
MNEEKTKSKFRSFLRFDAIALILGFVVDTITIVSIVLSLQIPGISKNLPNFITPGLAFGLWILAVYIYFGFLQSIWDKHQGEKNFSERFSMFLADDLLFGFRHPALLFPAVVALVCLFWIASTDESGALLIMLSTVLLLFGGVFLAWLYDYVAKQKAGINKGSGIPQEFKERVSKEWRFLSSQINQLLAKEPYVDSEDLITISTLWEVPQEYMNYILVQFAIKNPKRTKFGSLFFKSSDDGRFIDVNSGNKVLINLETIEESIYYIE